MSKSFDLQASLNIPAQLQEQKRTAYEVHAQILNSAKAAQENLYQMAMGFKRMRDEKLYVQLGYENFGDYCEGETGMKRRSVYQYISVVKNLPADFVQSTAQIGKEKLYLLSTLTDEEREQVTDYIDVEDTTVKELRAEIERLKADNKAETDALKVENINLKAKSDEAEERANREQNEYKDRIAELQQQITELENRPVETVFEDNSEELLEKQAEIERLKEALDKLKPQVTEVQTAVPVPAMTANFPKIDELSDDFDKNVELLEALLKNLYDVALSHESTDYTAPVLALVTGYHDKFMARSKEIRLKRM